MKIINIAPAGALEAYTALQADPSNEALLVVTRVLQHQGRQDLYGVLFTRAGSFGNNPVYHAEPYWQRTDDDATVVPWCNVVGWERENFGKAPTGDPIIDAYTDSLEPPRLVTITGLEKGSTGMTNLGNLDPIFTLIGSYTGNEY